MRVRILLSVMIAAAVCYGSRGFAQQAAPDAQPADKQAEQKGDKDLAELARELEAAEQEGKKDESSVSLLDAIREALGLSTARERRDGTTARDRLMKDPKWVPTHEQVKRFDVGARLVNMCLDSEGRVLACCGDNTVRVFSQEGQLLETRRLPFAPEAIGVRPADGAVFITGQGHLVRTSAEGRIEQQCEFPPPPTEKEKKELIESAVKEVEARIARMKGVAKDIEKKLQSLKKKAEKEDVPEEEKAKVAAMPLVEVLSHVEGVGEFSTLGKCQFYVQFESDTPLGVQIRALEFYLKQYTDFDPKQLKEQATKRAVEQRRSTRFTGLAVAEKDLFVVCSGRGYSYDVWRMDHQFGEPKRILTGLRGCCGQLDCQTLDGNLWVAMNTRHRVYCYDRNGKKISEFGRRSSRAADGFGGCCEPKNIRFSKDGKYIYCAESGPPVCVKRFTLDGQFQDVVCFPVYKTGCVRVAVDTSGDTFFMMSPNENAIYVFRPKQQETKPDAPSGN